MTETGKVTSKFMVNIPVRVRKRYGIKPGDELAFVERGEGVLLIRVPPLKELFGSAREHAPELFRIAREIEEDRRKEARAERS